MFDLQLFRQFQADLQINLLPSGLLLLRVGRQLAVFRLVLLVITLDQHRRDMRRGNPRLLLCQPLKNRKNPFLASVPLWKDIMMPIAAMLLA